MDDFREGMIFELYKDTAIISVKKFEKMIFDKYGFVPSKELSRKVANYQIKKYGGYVTPGKDIEYNNKYVLTNTPRTRINAKKNDAKRHQEKAYLERIERLRRKENDIQ